MWGMTSADLTTAATAERFDVPPSSFGPLWARLPDDADRIIDFDETLFLSNSTEDYLASARPAWLMAWLLLLAGGLARLLKRLPGGDAWVDPMRVALVTWLIPGTLRRWRAEAPQRVAADFNTELWAMLAGQRERLRVVSAGFRVIIEPLLAASPAAGLPLLACETGRTGARQRRAGKVAMLHADIGERRLATSAAVTDAVGDLPLLDAVGHPFRVVWPNARYRRAGDRVYLPLRYVTRIKHPGEQLIRRVILMEDFAVWWLATVFAATQPLAHTAGLLALLLSFWCVYERGYAENDHVARKFERDGVLGPHDSLAPLFDRPLQGWIWALGSGAVAVLLLRPDAPLMAGLIWFLTLLALRLTYTAYNYSYKPARLWLYPLLQGFRGLAPLAVIPFVPVGVIAGIALALSRWMPYFAYRTQGGTYQHVHLRSTRFVLLLLLLGGLALAGVPIDPLPALALVGWLGLLAATRLWPVIRDWQSITRDRLT
tara:strand:- start:2832 stop:4292 length:1461 start_codon:yes stop_codon:yes gene_type:complete